VDEEDTEGLRQESELLELSFTGNLGPYVLDSWNRGAGTSYVRNDDYYLQDIEDGPQLFNNAPYFETAAIDVVKEQASRLGALQTGEADAAGIPPERFTEFAQKPDINVLQIPQPFNQILAVNMRDNGWNSGPGNLFRIPAFRRALACAINKNELIQGVYRGLADPHFTWQPRFSSFYPGDDAIPTYGTGTLYGRETAREFAREAFNQSTHAYSFDGDALVTPDGQQVSLDIYHSAGQDTEAQTAEFVAAELDSNLGISVTVEAIDGTRYVNEYWTADPVGGQTTIDGEVTEWETPTPNNPGPRSVTATESWDMSLVVGLNTFPRNPLTNQDLFDGANARYNPVGYYPT
ncbi:MAG: bacterial extracellular solute-binding protein, partial [Halonotius sp. J07HN6]